MLSFTDGKPIAAISGGKYNENVLRLSTSSEQEASNEAATFDQSAIEEILAKAKTLSKKEKTALTREISGILTVKTNTKELIVDDGVLFALPDPDSERVLIAGKSGSGKSTLAALYMFEYARMFPERRIFLISRHSSEKTYDSIEYTQLPLEEFGDEEPLGVEELKDSLVVFDDTDNLQDKKISEVIKRLNEDLISNGRKYNIHVVTLVHQLMNYKATRNLILEANKVFVFPSGAAHHVRGFLEKYGGLEKDAIAKVLSLPKIAKSRWAMLSQSVPQYVLHEHGAFVL